jgi:DnaJ-class molecular chaperone
MSTGSEEQGAESAARGPCLACRGSGQVISGLGGTPHSVTCPWCQGTGHRIAGIDAQEHPSESNPGTPS